MGGGGGGGGGDGGELGGKGDQGCMVSSKRVCVANAWTSMLISSTWSGGSTHSYGQTIAARMGRAFPVTRMTPRTMPITHMPTGHTHH